MQKRNYFGLFILKMRIFFKMNSDKINVKTLENDWFKEEIRGHMFTLFDSYALRCPQSQWSAFESLIISTLTTCEMIVVTTTKH